MGNGLKFVVVRFLDGAGTAVVSDAALEEVRFLAQVHHLGEPGQGIRDRAVERGEAHALEAAVADVVDVGKEFLLREADGGDGRARRGRRMKLYGTAVREGGRMTGRGGGRATRAAPSLP